MLKNRKKLILSVSVLICLSVLFSMTSFASAGASKPHVASESSVTGKVSTHTEIQVNDTDRTFSVNSIEGKKPALMK